MKKRKTIFTALVAFLVLMLGVNLNAGAQDLFGIGGIRGMIPKKAKTAEYDPSVKLKKGMARTIYIDPKTGKKMMLDRMASEQYSNGDVAQVKSMEAWMKDEWKDKDFMNRVKELFVKRFPTAQAARIDSKANVKYKIGFIGAMNDTWQYRRNSLGIVIERFVRLRVIFEFEDGEVITGDYEMKEPNAGGGNYDDESLAINFFNSEPYNIEPKTLSGWEVQTDCYTSTLK
ncbi:MAG: hypothetical protein J6T60_04835 [Bacteroidales bacterium]|nr:hypothetical protein [Bacteroidales bacterium]